MLPVELLLLICEDAAAGGEPRWVGQSLALVCRAVYDCVTRILFRDIVVQRRTWEALHSHLGMASPALFQHTRALVTQIFTNQRQVDWRYDQRLVRAFAHVSLIAVPFDMFTVLSTSESFRPTTVFLDYTWIEKRLVHPCIARALSRVTHLYSGTSIGQFPVLLPALTHAVLGFCCLDTLDQLLDQERCPRLERLLARLPSSHDMRPALRQREDDRIRIVQPEDTGTSDALRALGGDDIWNEGFALDEAPPLSIEYHPLL